MGGNGLVAVAYLSWGMWVAACPRPGCLNAEKAGRCDDGTAGGLEAARFTCRTQYGGCGLVCGVEWPPDIEAIEAVVLARPPANRNWSPGEDVRDLLVENAGHGIEPTEQQMLAVAAAVTGGVPELAAARERLQIGA